MFLLFFFEGKAFFTTNNIYFIPYRFRQSLPGIDPVPTGYWYRLISVELNSVKVRWGHWLMRYYDAQADVAKKDN